MIQTEEIKVMQRGIQAVNKHFDTEIRMKSRKRSILEPRQVYFYLMARYSKYKLKQIGESLNLDYSTVIHARAKIESLMDVDDVLRGNVDSLRETFIEIAKNKKGGYKKELLNEFYQWLGNDKDDEMIIKFIKHQKEQRKLKKKVSYSEFINAKRTLERNPEQFVKEQMIKTIENYESNIKLS